MDDVGTTAKDTQAFIASLEWLHPLTGGLDERHPLSLSTASNDVYCGPTHKKFVPAIFLMANREKVKRASPLSLQ